MREILQKLLIFNFFTFSIFAEDVKEENKFLQIILDNAPIGPLIWFLIFCLSAASLTSIISGMIVFRKKVLLPPNFVEGVVNAMEDGDLDKAVELCENNSSPIANILLTGFSSIDYDFTTMESVVDSTTQVEVEKINQKIGLLGLYGQLAPMLGLLGTVTGMVAAFDSLGNSEGAEKAKLLGIAISQALWTTCAGLLIAIPAIFVYTVLKNKATRILLESEKVVVDLLKDLRNIEIEEE